jgi:hypothetical protein
MTNVLNWVKANWLIVALSALMVVCLPTFFFVGEHLNASTRESIKTRVDQKLRDLKGVEGLQVELKPLLPGAEPFSDRLPINEEMVNQYERIAKTIKADADQIVGEALAANRKDSDSDLLVPGLFPEPPIEKAEDLPYRIHDAYLRAHERLLAEIDAGSPIDYRDLDLQLSEFDQTYRRNELNAELNTNLPPAAQAKLTEALTEQRMAIYRQTASDLSVFAGIECFNLDEWSTSTVKPEPERMFNWQFAYWFHSDIVEAIKRANTRPDGKLTSVVGIPGIGDPGSVVKRVTSISVGKFAEETRKSSQGFGRGAGGMFANPPSEGAVIGGRDAPISNRGGGPEGDAPSVTRGGRTLPGPGKGRGAPVNKPKAVAKNTDDPTRPLTLDFETAASITGRVDNAMYDVRLATVELVVDSRRIPQLIKAISAVNFMTVTAMEVQAIDPYQELRMGYFFGSDPVVNVTMTIESLWMRDWTVGLMPDEVKVSLGIEIEDKENKSDDG